MGSIQLGVNIDHVATLRQARQSSYPCPIHAALIAEQSGADGITLHLREDRRHIQDDDVYRLRSLLQTRMNLEIAPNPQMIDIAIAVRPEHCCLVPENRQEVTTEGGLNLSDSHCQQLRPLINELMTHGIAVSLFIDPTHAAIDAAIDLAVPAVELHTGGYAASEVGAETIAVVATYAASKGLVVNAGHGLTRHNVSDIAAIEVINELNIGHAIVSDAVYHGFAEAVSYMKRTMLMARK